MIYQAPRPCDCADWCDQTPDALAFAPPFTVTAMIDELEQEVAQRRLGSEPLADDVAA
jgi:hypothetical protein